MKSVVALVLIACLSFFGCSSPTSSPSKPSPYSHVPPSAKGVLVSMQKLRAKLKIGISCRDYDSDVASIYADVSVFAQSPEGKELPELAALFNNASDCYLKVREIWGRESSSLASPREQLLASWRLPTR